MNGKERPAGGSQAGAQLMETAPPETGTGFRFGPDQKAFVLAATAVVLALDELGKMHALEQLPAPATLLARLEARTSDFNLLVGVTRIYLRAQAVSCG